MEASGGGDSAVTLEPKAKRARYDSEKVEISRSKCSQFLELVCEILNACDCR